MQNILTNISYSTLGQHIYTINSRRTVLFIYHLQLYHNFFILSTAWFLILVFFILWQCTHSYKGGHSEYGDAASEERSRSGNPNVARLRRKINKVIQCMFCISRTINSWKTLRKWRAREVVSSCSDPHMEIK